MPKKKTHVPTITFEFDLVEHGYEYRIYIKGEEMGFECRDFGGDHRIDKLAEDLIKRVQKTIEQFRKAH